MARPGSNVSRKPYKIESCPDRANPCPFSDFEDNNLVSPRDWPFKLWELDTEDEENNGLQNEDLIVWMRTAALPNFRKLYRKINHAGEFEKGLPKGKYELDIKYRK